MSLSNINYITQKTTGCVYLSMHLSQISYNNIRSTWQSIYWGKFDHPSRTETLSVSWEVDKKQMDKQANGQTEGTSDDNMLWFKMDAKNYGPITILKVITDLSCCLCHESLSVISPDSGTITLCWGNEVSQAGCHICFLKSLIPIYIYVQTNGDWWCFEELRTLVWNKTTLCIFT